MITQDTILEITIEVPMRDIEIIDPKVSYSKTDPQDPWEIEYSGIMINGMDYKIVEYPDNTIDDKLKQDWREL